MTIDQSEVQSDTDGTRYVVQVKDELDKNHGTEDPDQANQGRMYENPRKFNLVHM